MQAFVPTIDIGDERRGIEETTCLWCELGINHPTYSRCPVGQAEIVARAQQATMAKREVSTEIRRFGNEDEYSLRLAIDEEDRLQCWHLVYEEYLAHGYAERKELEYRYSPHDALPDTATFLVERQGRAVGTVSVFPDSPLGLPADDMFRHELDALRESGRRPVEVGRLTICREFINDRTVLAGLFDAMALYARRVLESTDLIITVNPSHVKFYERMLQFDCIGEQKDLDSVCGAPAVLLRLDREVEIACRKWAHGEGPKPARVNGHRTFYRYLSSVSEGAKLVGKVMEHAEAPSEDFLQQYFVWLNPILPTLTASQQSFFRTCYPYCDLSSLSFVGGA